MNVENIKSYLITCKGCEPRAEATIKHLKLNGVEPTLFRGVNGNIAGLRTTHPYTVDDPSGNYFISAGRVALNLNHWFIWGEALRAGVEAVMVFEDDCEVTGGFLERLQTTLDILNKADPDWDFLYAGHLEGSDQEAHKGNCYEWSRHGIGKCSRDPYGTHCYIVRGKALQTMIDTNEKVYTGTDINIWREAMHLLRHYACVPPLAGQRRDGDFWRTTLQNA